MLSIVFLLSFAVIAACSNVTIEFELGMHPQGDYTSVKVTFYVLKNYSLDYYYCHIYMYEGKLKL